MSDPSPFELSPHLAAALMQSQGHAAPVQAAADVAAFAARVLAGSRPAFRTLAFEDEPAGWVAAARRLAR